MRNLILNLVSFLVITVALFSCEDNPANDNQCVLGSQACSQIFKVLTVSVKDTEGNPIVLDDYYTFKDSRSRFEIERNNLNVEPGEYPVISDTQLTELSASGTTLIFVGLKDGRNIIEHQLVIGHDCCHVQLLQGEDEIII